MKGVIVAAGYGTRFLPVTKTIPKEMLPLINKPSISFIADEFVASGIDDIIIVTSRRKKSLEDFFDREIELETAFSHEGKKEMLEEIAPPKAKFTFVRQVEMLGTGHALMQVKSLIDREPCVVAYPDDLCFGPKPLSRQLIETWEKTGCAVLATIFVDGDVSRYGVLAPAEDDLHVTAMIEKPTKGTEPSHEVSIGRYLYTPEFFDYLEEGWKRYIRAGFTGEYFHTYALGKLMTDGKVVYKRTEGQRLDTGEPEGFLEALLTYADSIPGYREVIDRYYASRSSDDGTPGL
jgi:UTP--glucose-1-phosphate uridylyltransferase